MITTECSLDAMKNFPCNLVWGQMKGIYPNLSEVLVKVYRAPSSTSGVERNHKVGNRVLTQTRTRLTFLSVQKQLAIQHNNTQVKRKYSKSRINSFLVSMVHYLIKSTQPEQQAAPSSSPTPSVNGVNDCDSDVEDVALQWDEVAILLETSLLGCEDVSSITDSIIFTHVDE